MVERGKCASFLGTSHVPGILSHFTKVLNGMHYPHFMDSDYRSKTK
jgi:hypothetical protein